MPRTKPNNTIAKLGIRARQDALKTLIERHQEEFDKLHEENRVRAGLPRRSLSETPEQIRAKMERAEERLARYREQLEAAEADRKLAKA